MENCPTDTSINNCEFVGGQIPTGSLISLTNGSVIGTLFFNINGATTANSIIFFELGVNEGFKGIMESLCFSYCSGFQQGITTSTGVHVSQIINSSYVNYFMSSQMSSLILDTQLGKCEYRYHNISSSDLSSNSPCLIRLTGTYQSPFSYNYMDVRNNSLVNYFTSALGSNTKLFIYFSNSQFLMTKFIPVASSDFNYFISSDVAFVVNTCYFDLDSFTTSMRLNTVVSNVVSGKNYTVSNCHFGIDRDGSQIDFQLGKKPFIEASLAFIQNIEPSYYQNDKWMVENQTACVISRTYPSTAYFSPSNEFTPLPSPLPPSATPSVNQLYASLGAIACPIVAFGLAAIVLLLFRSCLLYNHDNYLLIEI